MLNVRQYFGGSSAPAAEPPAAPVESPAAARPRAYNAVVGQLYARIDELRAKAQGGALAAADLDAFEHQVALFVSKFSSYATINTKMKEDYDRLTLEAMSRRGVPDAIAFDYASAASDPAVRQAAIDAFREHGAIVLKSAIGHDHVASISTALLDLLQSNAADIARMEFIDRELYSIDGQGTAVKGYRAKANYPKTLISQRTGLDRGLVDIFNIDFMMPDVGKALSDAVRSPLVFDVLKGSFETVEFENLNIYYNNGVTDTRGFHVDAYTPKAKIFLYLTDVEIEDGPYCVALGSHKNLPLLKHNRRAHGMAPFKETDVIYTPSEGATAFRGLKGDVIISCQHASHRGYPQQAGHVRMMGVQSVRIG
ncbi:hypothetical protein ACFSCV_04300 [Methylopila henanensis]|uniref:Phytanoyl-CoA dioxygenase n=1 Tax=Methylopila henanensis TaxID=873516 RepID=A0ABW4K574_9HYPH